ncbi:MAG: hypothetical protein K6T78_01205 [Alicyclobacillus sp.]|nr:hypothetical protein [Alicyclobacillus sp.]
MLAIHIVVGIITLAASIVLLVWNGIRFARGGRGPSLSRVLVGLLDLQALLGIITYILHPLGGWWLLHPLFALAAVGAGHVLLKSSRRPRQQMGGYVAIFVFLVIGILVGRI